MGAGEGSSGCGEGPGLAIELNASGLRMPAKEMFPSRRCWNIAMSWEFLLRLDRMRISQEDWHNIWIKRGRLLERDWI